MSGVDPARFRALLGRFATGVTVLTARGADGAPIGMTASSVASVSLDPPLLLVCVDRRHEMHTTLETGGGRRFILNILAADQEALSRRFAEDAHDRFDGVPYAETAQGLPMLTGVVAHIECEQTNAVPAGDHTVYFGLVTGGSVSDRPPLLYYRGGYADLGT